MEKSANAIRRLIVSTRRSVVRRWKYFANLIGKRPITFLLPPPKTLCSPLPKGTHGSSNRPLSIYCVFICRRGAAAATARRRRRSGGGSRRRRPSTSASTFGEFPKWFTGNYVISTYVPSGGAHIPIEARRGIR